MKQISISERQMNVLMHLGRAVNDALTEFRGRTPGDVATAAHSAYMSMLGLQLPTIAPSALAPVPQKRAKRAKRVKKAAKAATSSKTSSSNDKTVSILSVLNRSKKLMPASEIAERTGISGQGLGPTLNMMFGNGTIVKKAVDGATMWGPKVLNGKATHAPN